MDLRKTAIYRYLKRKGKTGYIYARMRANLLYRAFRFKPWQDDEKYIQNEYMRMFGNHLDLDDPKTFNEKNNWRKLHDRNPYYTTLADKYKIKEIVSVRVGEGHTFPLIGKWDNPKDIDFDTLPEQFVLKVNHASGGIVVCRDKSKLDKKTAIAELRQHLKIDYSEVCREWPYKNIHRCVLAEAYMGEDLIDYKNYCFNGKLKYTFVWKNHVKGDSRKPVACICGAYDTEWKRTPIEIDYPSLDEVVVKPEEYDEMVRIVEAMSRDIPFVRVDCYIINGHVYVGEMTFFPWGGFMKFKDEEWNEKLGELQQLPEHKEF